MSQPRLVSTLFVLLVSAAASAQEGRRAVVYPLHGDGVAAEDVADVQMLLKVALLSMSNGTLRSSGTETLAPSCGPAHTAQPSCLAKLAASGVVLRGLLRKPGRGQLALDLTALDAAARVYGPARAAVDTTDARSLVDALEVLGNLVAQGADAKAPPPAAAPRDALPRASTTGAAPQAVAERAWMEPTALWLAAGAVAAAGGGALSGYLGSKLNDDLTRKYAAHTLTGADRRKYTTVRREANIANSLFIASGALAIASVIFWGLAPEADSHSLTVSGRF